MIIIYKKKKKTTFTTYLYLHILMDWEEKKSLHCGEVTNRMQRIQKNLRKFCYDEVWLK